MTAALKFKQRSETAPALLGVQHSARGYRWVARVESGAAAPAGVAADPLPVPLQPRRSASRMGFTPAMAALVMLAIAIAGTAWWIGRSAGTTADVTGSGWSAADPGRGSPAWPVQVTSHNGLDLQPSYSPQGDALAFVSDRSGSLEIYVRALDGAPLGYGKPGFRNPHFIARGRRG